MTEDRFNRAAYFCNDCVCWFKVSDRDGGIGACDCLPSDHNQHLVGYHHPACAEFIEVERESLKEWREE